MGRYERTSFHQSCRGNGDGMQAQGTIHNTGSPSGDRSVDQRAARERKAGPTGMAEGLVVLTKPGNAGGGKGPQLKADARSDEGGEIGDEPDQADSVLQEAPQRRNIAAKGNGLKHKNRSSDWEQK